MARGLKTRISVLIALPALCLLFLLPGLALAAPGDVKIASPFPNPSTGATFVVPVTVETSAGIALGAYDLTVGYNAAVVKIVAINGGSSPEFGAAPATNPGTFTSGSTDFNGANLTSTNTPTGLVQVASITFQAIGSVGSSSTLAVTINDLVDTDAFGIAPTNAVNGSVTVAAAVATGFNPLAILLMAILAICVGLVGMSRRGPAVAFLLPLVLVILLAVNSESASAATTWIAGDVNGDGLANAADSTLIRDYLAGRSASLPNPQAADVNGDGRITIADALGVGAAARGLVRPLSERLNINLVSVSRSLGGLVTITVPQVAVPAGTVRMRARDMATGETIAQPPQPDGSFLLQLPSAYGRALKITALQSDGTYPLPTQMLVPPLRVEPAIVRTGPAEKPPADGGHGSPRTETAGGALTQTDAFSGEYEAVVVDLSIKGRGLDLVFSRTYRSRQEYDGAIGYNWDHNFNKRLAKSDPTSATADIISYNGAARGDTYLYISPGRYRSAAGFFTRLAQETNGTFTLQFHDGAKEIYRGFNGSAAEGKLMALGDQAGNQLNLSYDSQGRLAEIQDTLGRGVTLAYNGDGRISSLTDFSGRTVAYGYDAAGNLVSVTTPAVTGTPTGNDFPTGKTTKYTYTAGSGPLAHNLETVTAGNEAAAGPHYLKNYYDAGDRVYRQDRGGTNASGVAAGGSTFLSYGTSETTITDRNGNVVKLTFNSQGLKSKEELFTRGVRPGDPAAFVTTFDYSSEGRLTNVLYPEGNSVEYTYDTSNNRLHRGNLLQITENPGSRGGAQASHITKFSYEPVYNQVRAVTDPRGNDVAFGPPVTPPGQSAPRYTTTNFFDYQEGADINRLAYAMGLTPAEVPAELSAAGISVGLGDLNQDGRTDQTIGKIVETRQPTVNLPAGSGQIGVEGGSTQDIRDAFSYNDFGQLTREVGPEGNVTDYGYYSLSDPDGDGQETPGFRYGNWSRSGWGGDQGGFLRSVTRDSTGSARRRETSPPVAAAYAYTYDPRGNITGVRDPNGNLSTFTYNQLDQLMRSIAPAPLAYRKDFFYDADNNLTRIDAQNVTVNGLGINEPVSADQALTTLFTYDILSNMLSRTDEVSAGEVGPAELVTTTYGYDSNENLNRLVKPELNETRYTYDERNLRYQTIAGFGTPEAAITKLSYDGNGNVNAGADAHDDNGDGLPEATNFTYDGYDRLVQTQDAAGGASDVLYDPVGNPVRQRRFGQAGGPTPGDNSGAGNVLLSEVQSRFDELDRVYETRDTLFDTPGGTLSPENPLITKYEYDRSGRRARLVKPKGNAFDYVYDGLDRLVKAVDAAGNETANAYDKNSNLTRTVATDKAAGLADERFTTGYQYDALNRLVRTTDNLGQTERYYYDSRGNVVWSSDAKGPVISDPTGEFPYSTTPGGVTNINDDGNTTKYVYDGVDRLVRTESHLRQGNDGNGALNPAGDLDLSNPANPDGLVVTEQDYDKNGRIVGRTDDELKTTAYAYDALDRLITRTNPDLTAESCNYDADSHLTQRTDENGTVVDYIYDALDRRVQEAAIPAILATLGGTTDQLFEYDGLGRPTLATDNNDPAVAGDDSSVALSYDSAGRVLAEIQNGARMTGSYDENGNRSRINYFSGRPVAAEYDTLDRLAVVNDGPTPAAPDIAAYSYIGPDRLLKRANLNNTKNSMLDSGETADIGYDRLGRLVRQTHRDSGGGGLLVNRYTYDRAGNRLTDSRLNGQPASDIFQYDSLNRLTANSRDATAAGDPSTAAFTDQYQYDGVGNRVTSTEENVSKALDHGQKNQYTFVSPQEQLSDARGNMTGDGRVVGPTVPVAHIRQYDYLGRLIRVNQRSGGGLVAKYSYDALDRRIRKETSTTVADYLWDGWRLIEERDASGATIAQYTYGNGLDEPLTMNRGGATYYYHQNDLGNVMALTDASGTVVEGYRYAAFGRSAILTGAGSDAIWFTADDATGALSSVGNRFMFAGREYDAETGLYYFRHRYYHPATGRFLTPDPPGAWSDPVNAGNGYAYVGNRPSALADPMGLGVGDPLKGLPTPPYRRKARVQVGAYSHSLSNIDEGIMWLPADGGRVNTFDKLHKLTRAADSGDTVGWLLRGADKYETRAQDGPYSQSLSHLDDNGIMWSPAGQAGGRSGANRAAADPPSTTVIEHVGADIFMRSSAAGRGIPAPPGSTSTRVQGGPYSQSLSHLDDNGDYGIMWSAGRPVASNNGMLNMARMSAGSGHPGRSMGVPPHEATHIMQTPSPRAAGVGIPISLDSITDPQLRSMDQRGGFAVSGRSST